VQKLMVAGAAFVAVAIVALLATDVRSQGGRSRAADRVGLSVRLEVQGVISGFFTEVSGLGSESEIIEHKVVDEKGREVVRKIPGRLKWQDISLKRGVTSNLDVWAWRKLVEVGDLKAARKDGSITVLNATLEPVAQWNFQKAWPSKVSGRSLDPDAASDAPGRSGVPRANAFVVEELTLTHEFIERAF
jgi:phage tail-like protein